MDDLKKLLSEYWERRGRQDLEECFLIAARIRSLAPVVQEQELRDEMELMEGSLQRARGQIGPAQERVAAVEARLLESNQAFPSRLLFERGVNSFALQDYAKALDDFLAVSARNRREQELDLLAFARLNALLCAEYLNLPAEQLLRGFQSLLESPRVQNDAGVIRQYDAYMIRQAWSRGHFESLGEISAQEWDQATYHLLYLKKLPQVSPSLVMGGHLEQVMEGAQNTYLRSFRLRTLMGHAHPEDLRISKFSDLVDRIYLWTWFWMTTPSFPLESVLELLEQVPDRLLAQPLTGHTISMLALALEWLVLLEPALKSRLRPLREAVELLRKPISSARFFEFEELFLASLRARIGGNEKSDAETLLRRHPLWTSEALMIRSALENPEAGHSLSALVRRCDSQREEKLNCGRYNVVVHLDSMDIERDGQRFESAPGCLAIQLLKDRGSVSCEEFLRIVFQQRGYEPHLHDQKIANLLARLRLLLPELKLQKRADRVQARGDWNRVAITGTLLALQSLRASRPIGAVKRQSQRRLSSTRDLAKLRELEPKAFSRKDLEQTLERPRATVNRLLARWIEEGRVKAAGRGRSTRYFVKTEWRKT